MRLALTATGFIWSRYATQITPVNYSLLGVNFFVGLTGLYQLSRLAKHHREQQLQEKSNEQAVRK